MEPTQFEDEWGPGAPSVVGELLGGPSYRESAEDRQAKLLSAIRRLHVEIETKQRDLMRLVGEAQRQGASWSKIGEAQNVSAQAAQQRCKRWQATQSTRSNFAKSDERK